MATDASTIPLVIAAGGAGQRLGGAKPLRMLGGRTLLDRALSFARSQSSRIAVAAGEEFCLAGVQRLDDVTPGNGPITALQSALRWAAEMDVAEVAMIGCDLPFLPPDLLARLHGALRGGQAALASSGGRIHPIVGLWRARALPALDSYAASGRRSLIGFAEQTGFTEVAWLAGTVDPFFNVNTPADLAAAEQLLRTPPP